MIDKRSTIFFTVLILVILISIGATYYRAIVLNDFERIHSEEELEEDVEEEYLEEIGVGVESGTIEELEEVIIEEEL